MGKEKMKENMETLMGQEQLPEIELAETGTELEQVTTETEQDAELWVKAPAPECGKGIPKQPSQIGDLKKWYFKELLESPVLGEVVRLYIEYEEKENLYDEIKSYLKRHPKRREKIKAELTADKERYDTGNLGKLSFAAGILSTMGIILSVTGTAAQTGTLVVILVVLAAFSCYVGLSAARNTACRRMIAYIGYVADSLDKKGKSKNL